MPRDKASVISCLKKKGFSDTKKTHHNYYAYKTMDGKTSSVYTYTSHSGKEIDDNILSQMAKQCKLSKFNFLKLIDCTLSQEEYELELKNKSLI
jgi:predicted RNA binding protein YcfA (HicA-like mRNA interferase family)